MTEYVYEEEMEEAYRSSLFKSFTKTLEDGFFPVVIVDAIHDKVRFGYHGFLNSPACTTLYSIINRTTWKYCWVAFIHTIGLMRITGKITPDDLA